VLYKDDDHLSVHGETVLAPIFDSWLERIEGGTSAESTLP
jgi:hypothetical protein